MVVVPKDMPALAAIWNDAVNLSIQRVYPFGIRLQVLSAMNEQANAISPGMCPGGQAAWHDLGVYERSSPLGINVSWYVPVI